MNVAAGPFFVFYHLQSQIKWTIFLLLNFAVCFQITIKDKLTFIFFYLLGRKLELDLNKMAAKAAALIWV